MSDPLEDALRVLGLEPDASEEQIKDAYRDLVKVWHPDRFGSDQRLRDKAQDRLKEINRAFERLRGYRPRPSTPPPRRDPPGPAATPAQATVERSTSGSSSGLAAVALLAALAGVASVWLMMGRIETTSTPALRATPDVVPDVRSAARPARPAAPAPAPTEAPRQPGPATTGALRVSSRPTGAKVVFDGRAVGETPMVMTDVAPGEHHVTVSLDGQGYEPWATSVVVAEGREEALLAVMAPKQGR